MISDDLNTEDQCLSFLRRWYPGPSNPRSRHYVKDPVEREQKLRDAWAEWLRENLRWE